MFTIGEALDFDLMSVELFLAKDTKALIIEGIPASELVLGTQNRQSIFRCELSVHRSENSLPSLPKDTIGTPDDCGVSQNPRRAAASCTQENQGTVPRYLARVV